MFRVSGPGVGFETMERNRRNEAAAAVRMEGLLRQISAGYHVIEEEV